MGDFLCKLDGIPSVNTSQIFICSKIHNPQKRLWPFPSASEESCNCVWCQNAFADRPALLYQANVIKTQWYHNTAAPTNCSSTAVLSDNDISNSTCNLKTVSQWKKAFFRDVQFSGGFLQHKTRSPWRQPSRGRDSSSHGYTSGQTQQWSASTGALFLRLPAVRQ